MSYSVIGAPPALGVIVVAWRYARCSGLQSVLSCILIRLSAGSRRYDDGRKMKKIKYQPSTKLTLSFGGDCLGVIVRGFLDFS